MAKQRGVASNAAVVEDRQLRAAFRKTLGRRAQAPARQQRKAHARL